jgi:hypothetical protein
MIHRQMISAPGSKDTGRRRKENNSLNTQDHHDCIQTLSETNLKLPVLFFPRGFAGMEGDAGHAAALAAEIVALFALGPAVGWGET